MTDNSLKAYAVVRADMSPGYQIVQTAHAVAEHERLYPGSMAGRTMIVVSVRDLEVLRQVLRRCMRAGITCTAFYEPDIGEYTAFAASPSVFWDEFAGLPLAGS
jgi:hypothetical protein